jgi:nicotinamidase-related amidase
MNRMSDPQTTPRRALAVIDVQNEYFSGLLPISHPPREETLANIGLAMDAAHAAGIPIVVVQNSAPAGAPVFARGSATWELHESVARRHRDHLIEKTLPSVYAGTDLDDWLKRHAIDTLTVVGYMTHNCDASTLFEAAHRGLQAEFLQDATGALPYANEAGRASAEEIHRVFSVVLHTRFAAVVSTRQWIDAVRAGVPLARSNILASHLAFFAPQSA